MKRFYLWLMAFVAILAITSCSKNDPVIFDGAFVYLADEQGNTSSTVDWDSQDYLGTYYVYLVTSTTGGDLNVDYELVVGEGLQANVDFKLISSTASPLMFMSGIYKMPIRIEWLKHALDAKKNNSLSIVLTSCSDSRVVLGKPGPDHIGIKYTITKK
ncbi:MAG: hypothetical protein RRY33_06850 [Alistipes sp.]